MARASDQGHSTVALLPRHSESFAHPTAFPKQNADAAAFSTMNADARRVLAPRAKAPAHPGRDEDMTGLPARITRSARGEGPPHGKRARLVVRILSSLGAAALAACSAADDTVPSEGAPGCGLDNATMSCVCGARPGRQICLAGVWSACDCEDPGISSPGGSGGTGSVGPMTSAPSFEGNLRTDITFDWAGLDSPVDNGECPPGRYEGNFQGIYNSIYSAGVIWPVANLDLPGLPSGFYYDLSPAAGGELTQKLTGQVDGLADLVFPFTLLIDGELNCRTGKAKARLYDGTYSILVDGVVPQFFEGEATADYDKRTKTFVRGVWEVWETSSLTQGKKAPSLPRDFLRDGFGGYGRFSAAFPTDLKDPKVKPCPPNYGCGPAALGPNKLICNSLLGTPACLADSDCDAQFPGEGVACLNASLFSLCVRECRP